MPRGGRKILSGSSVRRLGRLLPNPRVLALPNAALFFREDAPREVALAIAKHFRSAPRPRQINEPSDALCDP